MNLNRLKLYFTEHREITIIVLISLLVRLFVMPYTQSTDADATSRIFLANNLIKDFHLITNGIWGPIHFYLNAFFLYFIPSNVYAPQIMHILFASLSCIPLYYFTRNEFNKQGALFVALLYSFSPIVFRNSFMAMAEVVYGFFMLWSIYFISKGRLTDQKMKYAILAGLWVTIASGLRYEAWQLMAIFAGMILLFKEWRMFVPFCATALIFPIYWMIGNYIEHHDAFYGISAAYNWNVVLSGVNLHISKLEIVKRILYFPVSWVLVLSPFAVLLGIIGLFRSIKQHTFKLTHLIWAIPFFVMLITFIFKSLNGTLFNQHRFTISLLLLSVPFMALYFDDTKNLRQKQILVLIIVLTSLPLSFVWHKLPYEILVKNTSLYPYVNYEKRNLNIEAIPMIHDQSTDAFVHTINSLIDKEHDGLILDFIDWERTYFIAINAKVKQEHIFIIDGSLAPVYTKELSELMDTIPHGYMLVNDFSKLDTICESTGKLLHIKGIDKHILLDKVLDINNLTLYEYHITTDSLAENYLQLHQGEKGITTRIKDVNYYIHAINNYPNWLMQIQAQAEQAGKPLDEMIRENAEWMVAQDKQKALME